MNRLNVTRGDIDLGIDDQGSTEWSDVIQDRSTDLNPVWVELSSKTYKIDFTIFLNIF